MCPLEARSKLKRYTMKLIKKTVSNIPFDLHDSRIVKTEVNKTYV